MKKFAFILCALALAMGINAAPKTMPADTTVTISTVSISSWSGLRYILKTASLSFDFSFKAEVGSALESGHEYTLDDMQADYCGWKVTDAEYGFTGFNEVAFTRTNGEGEGYTLVVVAKDKKGTTWTLNYSEGAYVPQTFEKTMTGFYESFDYDEKVLSATLSKSSEELTFYFRVNLAEGEALESGKEYTLADMNAANSYAYNGYKKIEFQSASLKKTVNADESIEVLATVVDTKGDTWKLTYTKAGIVVENVTITSATINASSVVLKDAANNEYRFFFNEEIVSGKEYTLADMIAANSYAKINGNRISYKVATFKQTVAEDRSLTIAASFRTNENVVYNLSYAQAAPEIAKQTLTLNGALVNRREINAYNSDSTIMVRLIWKNAEIVGTWNANDFFAAQSIVEFKDSVVFAMKEADLTVAYDETAKNYTVNGTMLAVNAANEFVEFTLKLTVEGEAPEKPETYTLNLKSFNEEYDGISESVIAVLKDSTNDLTFHFAFNFGAGVYEIPAGEVYTLANMDSTDCYVENYAKNRRDAFTAVSFKKNELTEGKFEIQIQATDVRGNNWDLLYTYTPAEQEIVEVAVVSLEENGSTFILRDSSNNTYRFAINAQTVESRRTYTLEEMVSESSYATINGNKISYVEASFTKILAADGTVTILASFVTRENVRYELGYVQDAPTIVKEKLTLNGSAIIGMASQITAYSEDSTVMVQLFLKSNNLVGSWTAENFYTEQSFVKKADVTYLMKEVDIDIEYNETNANYELVGTMLTANENDALDQIKFTLVLTIEGAAPVAPIDLSFELQVTDSSIIITPSNNTNTWDCDFVTVAELRSIFGGDIDEFASAVYADREDSRADAGRREILFDDLLRYLNAGEYAVVVWGAENGITTEAQAAMFVLPEVEKVVSEMTFEFEQSATAVTVTPSNEDAWDYTIIPAQNASEEYIAALVQMQFVAMGDKFATIGENSISTEEMEEGEYLLVVWGVAKYNISTEITTFEFTINRLQAVDNIDAENGSTKRIVNGQLVIEKNGVLYNVMGATIK